MLRAADYVQKTDTGRQRRGNEDSSLARPPVFVVADGMGGAQAGEVASHIAVEVFENQMPDTGSPEERLVDSVQEANRQIYERSQTEHERAGMGTTLTAAYIADAHVAIAHVGDSRAYLFRDGDLTRLTQDHSLVDELLRRGKLTEEQAAEHPQRSIITRALGPEPEVEVDRWSYPMRADDVVLLCSDGLTSMITEKRIADVLRSNDSLPKAADQLIADANAAGGRDNITVVMFRLEELGTDAETDQPTMVGAPAPTSSDAAAAAAPTKAGTPAPAKAGTQAPAKAGTPAPAKARTSAPAEAGASSSTETSSASTSGPTASGVVQPPDTGTEPEPSQASKVPLARTQGRPVAAPEKRRRRWAKPVAALLATLIVLGLIAAGGYLASRQLYFIGTNSQGIVTVYRGFPYDLPAGIRLYETYYVSGVPASAVPADRRSSLLNHHLRSQSDATSLINALELGKLSR
jgi:serine/threonine protein phosphatase PrpC